MRWKCKHRGWWEAQGTTYRYRAVQKSSQTWELMVFGATLEATVDYPVTLDDCKHYAQRVESGKWKVSSGSLVDS